MPLIPFPNVPKLPGVPLIPRAAGSTGITHSILGAAQGMLWSALQNDASWGIWDKSGKPLGDPSALSGAFGALSSMTGMGSGLASIPGVGTALSSLGLTSTLSVNSVQYSKETKVSEFPIEKGSFTSYNKVELSSNPVITLCFSGFESDRTKFIEQIDSACKSTDLYDVVTPEKTYRDHSIERYRYERSAERGRTLMFVEISLKEVRQVTSTYSNPKSVKTPSATPKVDTGKVQPEATIDFTEAELF